MKHDLHPSLGREYRAASKSLGVSLLLLLGCASPIWAQQVVAPIDSDATFGPQTLRTASTPAPTVTNDLVTTSPFQSGSIVFRPHVVYRYLYGDGIQPRPGLETKTSINSIAPGLQVDFGPNWTVDYTPTWTYYSNDAFDDTVDQFARLGGIIAYGNWGFQLSQDYSEFSPPLIETGGQTKQETYNSNATVSYQMGSKALLDLAMRYSVVLTDTLSDSRDRNATAGFRYQFTPTLDAGLTFGVGKVRVSAGSDMTYYQPQARFTWKPTQKFTLSASGGMDYRQFATGGAEDVHNPIVNGELAYQPFENTKLSARIGRTVTASYFASQITENETWGFHFDQRIVEHLFLSADYGHYDTKYVSTDLAVAANREDSADTFNIRLSTAILKRGTIALFYQETRNDSSTPGFSVNSSQTGIEIGYRY